MRSIVYVVTAGIALLLAGEPGNGWAQATYPNRPLRFIVGNAPGGSTSLIARLVGEGLTARWGRQVVVDNRPGADGMIAAEALRRAAPDGHTLLLATASLAIRPVLHANPAYDDFLRAFVPVAALVSTDYVLVVNASVPAKDLAEFLALAKTRPGYLKGAVSNRGGANHLALELFNVVAGSQLKAVPYKGGGPGMTALLGGEVSFAFNNALTVLPHVRSGKLRAIGVGGATRLASLPQVPTFAEQGLSGYKARNWFGVVVPPRTPPSVVATLAGEIRHIQESPSFKEKLAVQGVQPFVLGPDAFRSFLEAEVATFAQVIKAADLKVLD